MEQAEETAIDIFAMGASFITCMIARGFISYPRTGHAADFHATVSHNVHETGLLLLVTVCFFALAGSMRVIHYKVHRRALDAGKPKSRAEKPLNVLATTLSLTAAWCLLACVDWFWLGKFPRHLLRVRLCVAISFSTFFVVA